MTIFIFSAEGLFDVLTAIRDLARLDTLVYHTNLHEFIMLFKKYA